MADSIREKIVTDIESALNDINNVKMGVVKREPMFRDQTEFYSLARTAFPHVIVTAGNEAREDLTTGGSTIIRQGILSVELICFVKASDLTIDQTINKLVEAIEEKLDADRTRGGNAKNTQVREIQMGEPMEHPYANFTMRLDVSYIFTRGKL
jgi:hypothetical protein